jgi:aminoglycoside/choline kinase family phosphotransferase
MNRLDTLKKWVESYTCAPIEHWHPLLVDASVRQYYRVQCANRQYVVMDTPVNLIPVSPYVGVAKRLTEGGVRVPDIFAVEPEQGFILLADFGDMSYQDALQIYEPQVLYLTAIDTLLKMQAVVDTGLLLYDAAFLRREVGICEEWYFTRHLNMTLQGEAAEIWERSIALLLARITSQPTVFVHRDYHCRNLMWVEGQPGVLDFQDAVKGPVTYDLISLLRDAYVTWPEEFVLDMAVRYWQKAKKQGLPIQPDFADFYQDFEWTGLQRHLKILGIFTRLYYRDAKDRYMADLPRVLHYIYKVTERYSELHGLRLLFARLHEEQAKVGYSF